MNSPTTSSGTGSESTEGLTASRITLMCDADLELDIRIKEIARRLADLAGNALWRANFATCLSCSVRRCRLKTTPSDLKRSPVGCGRSAMPAAPRSIDRWSCSIAWNNCWRQSCRRSDELNDLLASRNVEPAQSTITQSRGRVSAVRRQVAHPRQFWWYGRRRSIRRTAAGLVRSIWRHCRRCNRRCCGRNRHQHDTDRCCRRQQEAPTSP